MGLGGAISSGFRNYVNFTGRAPLSEYWFWELFYTIVVVVAVSIDGALFPSWEEVSPVVTLVVLALFLPTLAISIRRLHDIDRSGAWILIGVIPLLGFVLLIIWACKAGTKGTNRFGPDPFGNPEN